MLTKEQIQRLFTFCKQHYVHFYDVQVELVDHLAEAIEQEMHNNKKLSFEKALEKVYARFGIFGFSSILKEKNKQLFRQAKRDYWRLVTQQFRWPQILKGLTAGVLCYTLFSVNNLAGFIFLTVIVVMGMVSNLRSQQRLSRFVKKTGHKFMLMQYSFQGGTGVFSFYLLLQIIIHDVRMSPLVAGLAVWLFVMLFTAANQLSRNIEKKLRKDFSEVFGMANRAFGS